MQRRDDIERALDRGFAVICFEWDGTAVADRQADATAVRSRVERLTALGVDIAIVSGANVKNVDGQLHARPAVEGHLFLFLSRGSEVYVVGPNGPRLLERRQATDVEEAQLTAAAHWDPRRTPRNRGRGTGTGGLPPPAGRAAARRRS